MFSAMKLAITLIILLVSVDITQCQILAIGAGFDTTNALLKNVTTTSTTIMSTLQQMTTMQSEMNVIQMQTSNDISQISETDKCILSNLNETGDTVTQILAAQSHLLQTEGNILSKLNDIGDTQNGISHINTNILDIMNEIGETQIEISETDTGILNTMNETSETLAQIVLTETSILYKVTEIGETQSDISETDIGILNKMNEIGEIQNEMSRTNIHILSKLNEMSETDTRSFNKLNETVRSLALIAETETSILYNLNEIGETQIQISETDTGILNKLNAIGENQRYMSTTDNHILNTLNETGEFISQMLGIQSQMIETETNILNKLGEMGKTQSEMSNTDKGILSKLNEIGETQSEISDTDNGILNKLNEIGETQSEMSEIDNRILNKLNAIDETQSEMSQTDNNILNKLYDIDETQNEIANMFKYVVKLLQMQSQQLDNLTSLMASQVDLQRQLLLTNNQITDSPVNHARDCLDLASNGSHYSGSYTIQTLDFTTMVYCDMDTEGGGWTVFQQRFDGSIDFNRNWTEYKEGFGDVDGEHWAGLRLIHLLTYSQNSTLRVHLEAFNGDRAYAEYQSFAVGGSSSNYALNIGLCSGNAGDALRSHDNMQFSTYDKDNDIYGDGTCGDRNQGGWWYTSCYSAYLNGRYVSQTGSGLTGLVWTKWKNFEHLKSSTMMLRRNP